MWDWSPDGPGTPWSGPVLWVVDTARVDTILLALVVVIGSMIAARRAGAAQSARFLALAAFALATGGTEIDHIGDDASPRLLLNVVGCGAGMYGVARFLQRHRDEPAS